MSDPDLIDIKDVAPAEVSELDLYQKREKIYTRKIEGFFQHLRLFTGWPLLLAYLLLPWLQWGERQAVLFDLPARKFHIFGLVLWPQDFPLLAWLLVIAAFGLFAVTVFAGRIWCGYTCPQTVWTSIFMWWEQRVEGSRNQRIKVDKQAFSIQKISHKCLKHGGWLFFSLLTGMTFVGYFSPMKDLAWDLFSANSGKWQYLWTLFFTLATYINAGWLREQVCKYMCPYARFQSVMFDHNTLIVSYNPERGEPRGSRKHGADYKTLGLGECIDCYLCVQVCPTGIDIRDGLQYECIGCALCIDACNSVMDKLNYPKGLISYTSEAQLAGGSTHWLRPRIVGYVLALAVMVAAFSAYVLMRVPLELTVIRDRNNLYVTNSQGELVNLYTLSLVNMDTQGHTFTVKTSALEGARLVGKNTYTLAGGEVRNLVMRVTADPDLLTIPSTPILFEVEAVDNPKLFTTSESRFMRPL